MINPPSANKYGYWVNDEMPEVAKDWFAGAKQQPSSWWSDWRKWVEPYLGKEVPARVPGRGKLKVIAAAPGSYARVRAEA